MSAHFSAVRRLLGVAAGAGLALAGLALPAAAAPDTVPLNVGQETTGSHTGAHGSFSYTITDDTLCYTLEVSRLSAPAVGAHIHVGPRKVAGPVVVPLSVGEGTEFTVSDCVTVDAELLAHIDMHPRSYYVNVHTPTFPGGEVRGQLTH